VDDSGSRSSLHGNQGTEPIVPFSTATTKQTYIWRFKRALTMAYSTERIHC
jgi:hypothetical protein